MRKQAPTDPGLVLIARYEAAIVRAYDEREHGGAADEVARERAAVVAQARVIGDALRAEYRERHAC